MTDILLETTSSLPLSLSARDTTTIITATPPTTETPSNGGSTIRLNGSSEYATTSVSPRVSKNSQITKSKRACYNSNKRNLINGGRNSTGVSLSIGYLSWNSKNFRNKPRPGLSSWLLVWFTMWERSSRNILVASP